MEYAQARGLVIQVVLEDDSAWRDYDHERYYREIIARFGWLPAVTFNFCEEYNERYTLAEALEYMRTFARLDPYRHPRAIHNVNTPEDAYDLELTSIQTEDQTPAELNALAVAWRRKKPNTVVSFDEARPAARQIWWSVYMGGGMWESYVPL